MVFSNKLANKVEAMYDQERGKEEAVMVLSIGLTEEERELAESYARAHSLSLDEAFKIALFERIEDEYDVKIEEGYAINV